MTDLGWTIAAMLGFALVCVMTTVYLMSKRQITVNQHQENHAAPVVVNAGDSGGGLGLAPVLVGWAFKLLVAGFVLTALANIVISAGNGIGQGLQSIGNGLNNSKPVVVVGQQPAIVPTLAPTSAPAPTSVPRAVPVATSVPRFVPVPETATPDLMPVIIGVLAALMVGIWGSIGVMAWRQRGVKRTRAIAGQRNVSAREVFGVTSDVPTKEIVRR